MATIAEFKEQVMTLSEDDRMALGVYILDHTKSKGDSEMEQAWYDEAEKRALAYDQGRSEGFSLDEALERVAQVYQ